MGLDRLGICLAFVVGVLTCACSSRQPPALDDSSSGSSSSSVGLACAPGRSGCACTQAGETAACGNVVMHNGDYVSCSEGLSTCDGSTWGACVGNIVVSRRAIGASRSVLPLSGLGSPAPCANNPCDPYCQQTVDDPTSGFTAPPGFSATDAGLTLSGVPAVPCTSLVLTPSTSAVTVTSLTNPGSVSVTATALPAGCAPTPFATTWSIDQPGQATISGTTSASGLLTLGAPLPGTINITAYAVGIRASTPISIKINVVDMSGISPDTASSATQCGKFDLTGCGSGTPAPLVSAAASTATWLYPYAGTYLPLGLPAPIVMYKYATAPGTNPDSAVKVSLRYPAGATEATATFNYATIVQESTPDPQVYILQAAWQRFEQTARDNDATLVIQRFTGGAAGVLENENPETIHFANGQLKGTVYYSSYSSPQGGNTGAILSIAPGATNPTLAVQPGGTCVVCHSLNVPGTLLIGNGMNSGGYNYDQSQQYSLTQGGFPSPPVVNSYTSSDGDLFTYGGPRTDGSLYMTHGGSGTGDPNWHAPSVYSNLYSTTNTSSALSVSGWPSNMEAVTPRFSSDGSKLAFGFWGGSSLTTSSGTLAHDVTGSTLAVVDFSCGTGCTSGFATGNARPVTSPTTLGVAYPLTGGSTFHVTGGSKTVTATGSKFTTELAVGAPIVFSSQPATTYTVAAIGGSTSLTLSANYSGSSTSKASANRAPKVAWPSFFPDGSAVLYQRQILSAKASISWSASDLNSIGGAQADLWISDVPASAATDATPTRLNALDGFTATGTSYLPTTSRTVSPPTAYHSGGLNISFYEADNCGNSGTARDVSDNQLNYFPAVNPTPAGGYNWVVFTSRRMYGNMAYDNPWDAEPSLSCSTCVSSTGALEPCSSCTPGVNCTQAVPTKKLWVSALNSSFTPGSDPSHPAFYLPGQELAAGNSIAYWVNSACVSTGGSCASSDDCCGGTGSSPTAQCKITTAPSTKTCQPISNACVPAGGVCNVAGSPGDCCTGLTCPGVGGSCFNPSTVVYVKSTYTREFVGSCPAGTAPVWRYFQWQATVPSNTSLSFSIQSKQNAGDTYAPVTPLAMATATTSTPAGSWSQGTQTADQVLRAAGLLSQSYLLVSMTFTPDTLGDLAPTLSAWRQQYDCLASE